MLMREFVSVLVNMNTHNYKATAARHRSDESALASSSQLYSQLQLFGSSSTPTSALGTAWFPTWELAPWSLLCLWLCSFVLYVVTFWRQEDAN